MFPRARETTSPRPSPKPGVAGSSPAAPVSDATAPWHLPQSRSPAPPPPVMPDDSPVNSAATPLSATASRAVDVRRARGATAVVFAVHGCVFGSFAARVPWIAAHVGVNVGGLGVALLMPGIGALFAMPFSGRLAKCYAFRTLVTATIETFCASL